MASGPSLIPSAPPSSAQPAAAEQVAGGQPGRVAVELRDELAHALAVPG